MNVLCKFLVGTLLLTGPAAAQPVRPVVGASEEIDVSAGESLFTLGNHYSLAIEHFAFANHIPISLTVATARKLIVPLARVLPSSPPQNGLVVNLPERGVFLFRNGEMVKFFPLAIGQPGRFATPTGSYSLVSRVKNPSWLPPEWAGLGEKVVAAGPTNPLGDRWMGLSLSGVGFHSTTQPTSIGSAASHGCMRMYPDSAHELFDQVEVGMPVRIEYEPVKLGQDEQGNLYVVVFPDVYKRLKLDTEVKKCLAVAGMADWLSPAQIDKLVQSPTGSPEKIADANVTVTVDGKSCDLPRGVVMGGKGLFCSADVLRQAGFAVTFEASLKQLLVEKDGHQATFTMGAVQAPPPEADPAEPKPEPLATTFSGVMLGGKAYVPAHSLVQNLSYPVRWNSQTRTVEMGAVAPPIETP